MNVARPEIGLYANSSESDRLLVDPKELQRAHALDKDGRVVIPRATGLADADIQRH